MTKIIKIHGCSGAGKTTAVRELLPLLYPSGYHDGAKGYVGFVEGVENPVYVAGSYKSNCGGVDTINSAKEVMNLINFQVNAGSHVIYEGLLQSTYYGIMGEWSKQFGDRFIYAFLDTPVELCLERVLARRKANDSKNKFDPQLTRDKWESIARLREKLLSGSLEQSSGKKHLVVDLRHEHPMLPQLLNLLQ